jgi:hypothetical protein
MAGTNLEARGIYIPRPLTPGRSHLIRPRCSLSPQRPHKSFIISDEPPQDFLAAGGLVCRNSSLKNFTHFIAESNPPSTAMDPGSPSRHPSEAKEEDSPL